jgi:hypothetical protein
MGLTDYFKVNAALAEQSFHAITHPAGPLVRVSCIGHVTILLLLATTK